MKEQPAQIRLSRRDTEWPYTTTDHHRTWCGRWWSMPDGMTGKALAKLFF